MKFKVGDKVQVKTWEEIKKTLDHNQECRGVYFANSMKTFCGKVINIHKTGTSLSGAYSFIDEEGDWCWVEDWIEPVKNDFVVTIRGISPGELKKAFGERIKELEIISQPRPFAEIYEELLLSAKDCRIEFAYKGWTTLAIVWKYDGTVETGYARRKPSDASNRKAGQSLALARALGRKDIEEELLAFM